MSLLTRPGCNFFDPLSDADPEPDDLLFRVFFVLTLAASWFSSWLLSVSFCPESMGNFDIKIHLANKMKYKEEFQSEVVNLNRNLKY